MQRENSTIHILSPKLQRIKAVAARATTKIPANENPWEAAPLLRGAGAWAGGEDTDDGGRGDTDDGDGAAAGVVKEETLGDVAGDSATTVRMNIVNKSIVMQVWDILKTRERERQRVNSDEREWEVKKRNVWVKIRVMDG